MAMVYGCSQHASEVPSQASEVPIKVDRPDSQNSEDSERASDEASFYNKMSKMGALASHKGFRTLGLVMTVFFLVWQGIDTDYNDAVVLCEAQPVFQAVHMIFFVFFGTEALVRFCAVRDKRQIFKCRALIWDSILVIFLFVRIAVTAASKSKTRKILMIVTLVQFTRQFRLFKRPNKTETASLKVDAAKEFLRCFLLVTFLHYMFAIALSKLTQDTEVGEEYFPDVMTGIQSLHDVSNVARALLAESKGVFIPYVAFCVRSCVVVLLAVKNVLIQMRTNHRSRTPSTQSVENDTEEIAGRV
jgi:hypothetical protein